VRVLLRNVLSVLSASFLLVNVLTWSTFAIILGKSLFRNKSFGTAPGLLVGCAIGACFSAWLAIFFAAAHMQSSFQIVRPLLSDSDAQLLQACYGLGFTAGIVYVRACRRSARRCALRPDASCMPALRRAAGVCRGALPDAWRHHAQRGAGC
jgi:hypothetical protein